MLLPLPDAANAWRGATPELLAARWHACTCVWPATSLLLPFQSSLQAHASLRLSSALRLSMASSIRAAPVGAPR